MPSSRKASDLFQNCAHNNKRGVFKKRKASGVAAEPLPANRTGFSTSEFFNTDNNVVHSAQPCVEQGLNPTVQLKVPYVLQRLEISANSKETVVLDSKVRKKKSVGLGQ